MNIDMNDATTKWLVNYFKAMYDMMQSEDWNENRAQELIASGSDFYMDHFMNWN